MIRAMAKEAEATRERTAAIIRADGELQAAKKLTQAAKVLKSRAIGIELRQLQTLERISKEPNQNTIIVPHEIFESTQALVGTTIAGLVSKESKMNFDDSSDDNAIKFQ